MFSHFNPLPRSFPLATFDVLLPQVIKEREAMGGGRELRAASLLAN